MLRLNGPVQLRAAGNSHVKDILQRLFQYIELLRGPAGVSEALYADNAALCRLRFDFRDHPSAFNYTSSLANLMHDYPAESLLLVQHHVPLRFDEAVTRSMLAALTPADCSVMWASHEHSSDGMDTEPWCALHAVRVMRAVHAAACSSLTEFRQVRCEAVRMLRRLCAPAGLVCIP